MPTEAKRRLLRIALGSLFVLAIGAALLRSGWSGYVWLAAAIAFYICYVLYADMACPSCRKRLLSVDGFLPPKNMWRPTRECPHCKADLTREVTDGNPVNE